jgi:hypothetical protein
MTIWPLFSKDFQAEISADAIVFPIETLIRRIFQHYQDQRV